MIAATTCMADIIGVNPAFTGDSPGVRFGSPCPAFDGAGTLTCMSQDTNFAEERARLEAELGRRRKCRDQLRLTWLPTPTPSATGGTRPTPAAARRGPRRRGGADQPTVLPAGLATPPSRANCPTAPRSRCGGRTAKRVTMRVVNYIEGDRRCRGHHADRRQPTGPGAHGREAGETVTYRTAARRTSGRSVGYRAP